MTAPSPHELPLHQLLALACEAGASDLHLTDGLPPSLRVHGELAPVAGRSPLPPGGVEALARPILTANHLEAWAKDRTVDLGLELGATQRFRVNVFSERGGMALAARRLDERIRSLEELRLPPSLGRLADFEDGLVLVCGATGSGKSTTLATLIDAINRDRAQHIITLEDPIEYVHQSRRSIVHQRELHRDFRRFSRALRATLREDPDVILVGELRDLPTMRAALMAAETGHLVFSTLHSGSAIGATERLIGAFRGDERDAVRHQLSLVLRAVVAQQLLPLREGRGRFPAVELLQVTPAVANLIRAGKSSQVQAAIEAQSSAGMLTLEQSLAEAVVRGWIDELVAASSARDPQAFAERLRHVRATRPRTGRVAAANPGAGGERGSP